jgi:hypothetical protein
MDYVDQLDLIGTEVVLTGDTHAVRTGTRGFVTGYGSRRAERPIQVTFDDEERTVRYYDTKQFEWLFTVLS